VIQYIQQQKIHSIQTRNLIFLCLQQIWLGIKRWLTLMQEFKIFLRFPGRCTFISPTPRLIKGSCSGNQLRELSRWLIGQKKISTTLEKPFHFWQQKNYFVLQRTGIYIRWLSRVFTQNKTYNSHHFQVC